MFHASISGTYYNTKKLGYRTIVIDRKKFIIVSQLDNSTEFTRQRRKYQKLTKLHPEEQ